MLPRISNIVCDSFVAGEDNRMHYTVCMSLWCPYRSRRGAEMGSDYSNTNSDENAFERSNSMYRDISIYPGCYE